MLEVGVLVRWVPRVDRLHPSARACQGRVGVVVRAPTSSRPFADVVFPGVRWVSGGELLDRGVRPESSGVRLKSLHAVDCQPVCASPE